ADVGQPATERRLIGHVGEHDNRRRDVAASRARTPREHRPLEGAYAWRHEIDMRRAAAPSLPRAVLLVARGDSPFAIPRHEPVVTGAKIGRAGEARSDGVEQRLAEVPESRAVHADGPDAAQHGIVGWEGLCACGRSSDGQQRERSKESVHLRMMENVRYAKSRSGRDRDELDLVYERGVWRDGSLAA